MLSVCLLSWVSAQDKRKSNMYWTQHILTTDRLKWITLSKLMKWRASVATWVDSKLRLQEESEIFLNELNLLNKLNIINLLFKSQWRSNWLHLKKQNSSVILASSIKENLNSVNQANKSPNLFVCVAINFPSLMSMQLNALHAKPCSVKSVWLNITGKLSKVKKKMKLTNFVAVTVQTESFLSIRKSFLKETWNDMRTSKLLVLTKT